MQVARLWRVGREGDPASEAVVGAEGVVVSLHEDMGLTLQAGAKVVQLVQIIYNFERLTSELLVGAADHTLKGCR